MFFQNQVIDNSLSKILFKILSCRVPLAEILVICGFLMIYLIEELAHVLLHKVRSAEKSKDECSVACTGMRSSINSISMYEWSSTYAISTVAWFPPSTQSSPHFSSHIQSALKLSGWFNLFFTPTENKTNFSLIA